MISAIGATSVNIPDIVVLAVLVLGVLMGVVSGFAKMLKGAIGTLFAIIISILLGVFLCTKLADVGPFMSLQDTIEEAIISAVSGSGYLAKVDANQLLLLHDGAWTDITEIFTSGVLAPVAGTIESICVGAFASTINGGATLAGYFAKFIVDIIAGIAIFVVAIIVIQILFSILSNLFIKATGKQRSIRSIDKVLGMFLSLIATLIVIYVCMFAISKIGGADALVDTIISGNIAKWFYENNPLSLI